MIRVVVADDHPVVLSGVEQILRAERDFEVVATCTDGEAALASIRQHLPDVAILDLRMPRRDGLSVLRDIRKSLAHVRVILLTAALTRQEAEEAMQNGVDGVVLKEAALGVLVQAARTVHSGRKWLDSTDLRLILHAGANNEYLEPEIAAKLTGRESEIVMMIAHGKPIAEIARDVGISEGSVRIHAERICRKARLNSPAEIPRLVRTQQRREAAPAEIAASAPQPESAQTLRLQRRFGLTPREAAVAALLAEGCANKEIADALNITINTVKTHIAAVHSKTEVSSTRKLLVLLKEA